MYKVYTAKTDLITEDELLKARVLLMTRKIIEFSNGLTVETDEDCRRASEFLAGPLKTLTEVINQTFDPALEKSREIRRIALDQMKHLQNSKLAWVSPILSVEKTTRELIEMYLLKKELECDKVIDVQRDDDRLMGSGELLWKKLADAKNKHEDDVVDEILEMLDQLDGGDLILDEVPEGEARANNDKDFLSKGVSSRTYWTWEVVNLRDVNVEYIGTKDSIINRKVKKYRKKAEGIVGGIRVFKKKGLAVRRKKS